MNKYFEIEFIVPNNPFSISNTSKKKKTKNDLFVLKKNNTVKSSFLYTQKYVSNTWIRS